ncbi:MAG: deoxyguanosinetriphosphate triphosphohydrolase [Actinomycetaceae bacterium]|nr:deoxyguanosinetriphosphate triphosphohydrolase [Actinomycetaceae bacterium]
MSARLPNHQYSDFDRERFVRERPKSPNRTDFERDRARILHSAAFRRLGEKTQVLGPATDDFVRTRLTHSLEVAQVGREIGKELGADPDVVDAACLAHDLGHPPFGHNGERALDSIAQDAGGFEGNAQTFRLLVRLEPKVLGENGEPRGVNLTRASLDAACKYPWGRGQGPDPVKSMRKYSVYPDDMDAFNWMREDRGSRKCLEAQIMDLSDDIAYSVHDVEDAIMTGKFDVRDMRDDAAFEGVVKRTRQWYAPDLDETKLQAARERLLEMPYWLDSFDSTFADRARLKDMTSQLIGQFSSTTVSATRSAANLASGEGLGRYDADLVVPEETATEILLLKGIAAHYVMAPREHESAYHHQGGVLVNLVETLMDTNGIHLEEPFASFWRLDTAQNYRLRVVIDQVASLTDMSAQRMHASLCGMFGAF